MRMALHNCLLSLLLVCSAIPANAIDLLELFEGALATNPGLKGHEYAIDQATAQKDQALSKLLPQVNAVGNLSYNTFSQNSDPSIGQTGTASDYQGLRGVIQARQALFDLPNFLRFQGADFTVQQKRQELEATRMDLAGELVDRYLKVLEADDSIAYIVGEQQQTERQIERLRHMQKKQLATVTDLYEVEAYYQALLTEQIKADNAKAVALEKVREITGIVVTGVVPLVKTDLPEVPGEIEYWVSEAGRNHPSLTALQLAIEAAQKNIYGSRAEHLPQLSLQMSETYADNGGYDNRQLPAYTVGSVGLQVNVPILAGGGVEASAREAEARYYMALEKRTEKLREIERQTRTAFLDAKTGRARIASTTKEVAFRQKARVAQEKSYAHGIKSIIDVLESKKNLLKARVEQAKARYDYIRSLVALRLWGGNLSQQDLEEINSWLGKR